MTILQLSSVWEVLKAAMNLPILLQNQAHVKIDASIDFSEMGKFFVLSEEGIVRLTLRNSCLGPSKPTPPQKQDGLVLETNILICWRLGNSKRVLISRDI